MELQETDVNLRDLFETLISEKLPIKNNRRKSGQKVECQRVKLAFVEQINVRIFNIWLFGIESQEQM